MKRKLIEVAIPLAAVNKHAAREKAIHVGHPTAMHLWWARRPLAICRAVLLASLIDDPSAHPARFPDSASQEAERRRLFDLIERLADWDEASNSRLLEEAHKAIRESVGGELPTVYDPFAGGGSIPLEAARLGLPTYGTDLNPVAVLVSKGSAELPGRFAGFKPVRAGAGGGIADTGSWRGAAGLAADLKVYGRLVVEAVRERIGESYPRVDTGRASLEVVAWMWARTVRCPNPACGGVTPLVRSFELSTGARKAFVEVRADAIKKEFAFRVLEGVGGGGPPTVGRTGGTCVFCASQFRLEHIKQEAVAGRIGARLMAIIADGDPGRRYLSPNAEHEEAGLSPTTSWGPDESLSTHPQYMAPPRYGLRSFRDLFTGRQLVALQTFIEEIAAASALAERDALAAGMERGAPLAESGSGARAYGEAIATYLAFALDKLANYGSSIAAWNRQRVSIVPTFGLPVLPMVWDFAEANPLSGSTGGWMQGVDQISKALARLPTSGDVAIQQDDATRPTVQINGPVLVSTDPPYYDNVPYADLSDFYYVLLRRTVGTIWPELFRTLLVPKSDELVADTYRLGGKREAKEHFESGLVKAFEHLAREYSGDYPVTIYYAFRQAEAQGAEGHASTGWETMLSAVLAAGLAINGTWPVRTEQSGGLRESGRNALASSIVLVCRPRPDDAGITDRKAFLAELRSRLPEALRLLQHGNIAPVDLAQASIGPGMAVFSSYAKVVEPSGEPMSVRTALVLINQVLGEVLTEQEGDFDSDTRWAITWFEQHRYGEGKYGDAELLSKAKDTAVGGLEEAGIVESRPGYVRLLRSEELAADWDPATDRRTPIWEITQRLIHALKEGGGAGAAADIVRRTGGRAEVAKELAYRLYVTCERKNWPEEGRDFNSLVVEWPEITKLASGIGPGQTDLGLGG